MNSAMLKIRARQVEEMAAFAYTAASAADAVMELARAADNEEGDGLTTETGELTASSLRVVADSYTAASRVMFAEIASIIKDCL